MTVGRPIEFDTRQALEVATRVFWQRGYDGTSLEALLDAMDISKSSLYPAFGGKSPLFQRDARIAALAAKSLEPFEDLLPLAQVRRISAFG